MTNRRRIGCRLNTSFEGFKTKNKVKEAQAKLGVLNAKIDSLKLQIYLEAKQSYLNLKEAEKSIFNASLQVKQATETLELANLRYETGLGTPLEVTDATVAYSDAKLQFTDALYKYRIAQSNIEKAMGMR